MSFNQWENQDIGGKPLLLLDFWRQTKHWLYTTADRPITFQQQVYQPESLSLTSMKVSQELRQQTLKVTARRDIDVVNQFRVTPPTDPVQLNIWGMHYGDDAPTIIWSGRVITPTWKGSKLEIACEPLSSAMQQTGLQLRWCRDCPYAVYGVGCGVDRNAFRQNGSISSVNGFTITAAVAGNFPVGRLAGGYVEWTNADGISDQRTIDSHPGGTFVVAFGSADLVEGLNISVYPGCNGTIADCDGYFNNLPNNGSAPNMPDQSPFNGSLVF